MDDAAVNAFAEPIAGTIPQTAPSSASAVTALQAVSLASQASDSSPPVKHPSLAYLDSSIHAGLMLINNDLASNRDETDEHVMTAEAALLAITDLIRITSPEQLNRWICSNSQRECVADIERYTAGYFEQVYDQTYAGVAFAEHDRVRAMFVRYCKGLLAMGVHSYRYESLRIYIGHCFAYKTGLELFRAVRPWLESQQASRQRQEIAQRRQQYASPDAAKECRADLSAAEKMQVFMQSVMSRNRVGQYNERGKFVQQVVTINAQTMPLVRLFFQLNPRLTVQHLNTVLDRCLELPTEYYDSDTDSLWHARNARNLSLFVRHLHVVAAQLGLLDALPPFVPVPPPEEAGEESGKL
jgi:hypothetical protein